MKKYKKVIIEIDMLYGIDKKPIPNEFKEHICKAVHWLFPNWNTISFNYTDEVKK